mmetsp:Transcript_10562/g.17974  ORF Transcript_10562/g.17974 Transcript_10562/m.17974 type:complete len:214 (+) Transcript_10562:491-1132(+)
MRAGRGLLAEPRPRRRVPGPHRAVGLRLHCGGLPPGRRPHCRPQGGRGQLQGGQLLPSADRRQGGAHVHRRHQESFPRHLDGDLARLGAGERAAEAARHLVDEARGAGHADGAPALHLLEADHRVRGQLDDDPDRARLHPVGQLVGQRDRRGVVRGGGHRVPGALHRAHQRGRGRRDQDLPADDVAQAVRALHLRRVQVEARAHVGAAHDAHR